MGVSLLAAALSVAAGVIVLVRPGHSLPTLAVVTGIFIWLEGMVELFGALFVAERGQVGLAAATGLVDLILGALLIRHPIAGIFAIALLVGLWLLAAGLLRLIGAFSAAEHRPRRVAAALVLAAAGVIVIASPHIGYTALAVITGIGLIAYGITMLLVGLGLRTLHARLPV